MKLRWKIFIGICVLFVVGNMVHMHNMEKIYEKQAAEARRQEHEILMSTADHYYVADGYGGIAHRKSGCPGIQPYEEARMQWVYASPNDLDCVLCSICEDW